MNIEVTAPALLSLSSLFPQGTSDEARFVEEQWEGGRRCLQDSHYSGMRGNEVFDELCSVADECRMPNWDGYGAEAVSQDTYRLAYRFLEALPSGFLAPSIGAEPDGHLTLEWHRSLNYTVSVSISPQAELHYSALVGPNRVYGTEAFFGEPPTAILDLIRRIQMR
jgi:hypothetical protein